MMGHFRLILARFVLVVDHMFLSLIEQNVYENFSNTVIFRKPKTPKTLTPGPAGHQLYARDKSRTVSLSA